MDHDAPFLEARCAMTRVLKFLAIGIVKKFLGIVLCLAVLIAIMIVFIGLWGVM